MVRLKTSQREYCLLKTSRFLQHFPPQLFPQLWLLPLLQSLLSLTLLPLLLTSLLLLSPLPLSFPLPALLPLSLPLLSSLRSLPLQFLLPIPLHLLRHRQTLRREWNSQPSSILQSNPRGFSESGDSLQTSSQNSSSCRAIVPEQYPPSSPRVSGATLKRRVLYHDRYLLF